MMWLTLVSLATWEAKIGRIKFQGQPRQQKQDPVSKIPNTKKGWGCDLSSCVPAPLNSNSRFNVGPQFKEVIS
jgi:hypothetical protein